MTAYRNTATGKIEPLPWTVRLPDGSTRTDPSQWWLDEEARAASGFVASEVTPDDLVPEPTPTCTPRQLRIWLVTHGITLDAVNDAIAGIPDATQRQIAEIEWNHSPYYERNHPMLQAIAASLGLTSEQVDEAFREASTL